jgi:cyclophilin family peptidyl-prolyl cis-trans isomerase
MYRNMAVGLLIVGLSLAGCRKKTDDVIDTEDMETTPGSAIIEPENVTVNPPAVTPTSLPTTPVTPPAATPPTPVAPEVKAVQVVLQTTKGDIVVELDRNAAPVTVANFVRYVNEGLYDGTVFHRVISGFMVQGGGFSADMKEKATHAPINNEASNGLKNERGTIAMARTPLPHSATSQFYINHRNNAMLDHGTCPDGYGYTVFGTVVKGMEVVDIIASAPTVMRDGEKSFPVQLVSIKKAAVAEGDM